MTFKSFEIALDDINNTNLIIALDAINNIYLIRDIIKLMEELDDDMIFTKEDYEWELMMNSKEELTDQEMASLGLGIYET